MVRLLEYCWRLSWIRLLLAIASAVLAAAALVTVPILTGGLIGMLPGVARGWPDAEFTLCLTGLLTALIAGHLLTLLGRTAGIELIGLSERESTARLAFAMSSSVELAWIEGSESASKLQKVRSRRWDIEMAIRIATGAGITTLLSLVGTSIALGFALSPLAALVLFFAALGEGEYLRRLAMTEMNLWSGQSEPQKHAFYAFEQGMGKSAKEIRIFGLTKFIRQRWWDNITAAYRPSWDRRRRGALFALAVGGGRAAIAAGAISYGAWAASTGALDLTHLATSMSLIVTIGSSELWWVGRLQRGVAVLAWLDSLVPEPRVLAPAISRIPRDQVRPEDQSVARVALPNLVGLRAPAIVFDEVTFRYPGAEFDVLRDLTWELPAGRAVALVGLNGTGKSTLVKLACGVYQPNRGRVLVDGVDLADLDHDQRRAWQRLVAPMTQDFVRLPLAAGDNVELGTGRIWSGRIDLTADTLPNRADLDAIAEQAGITDLVGRLESGWGTPLSKTIPGGTDLSGGEWQRIGLARAVRAVAAGAQLLILDEPAAALDVESEARMVDTYLDLTSGLTSLVISHRFSVVRTVPEICVLEDGRITETGSHQELMALGRRYSAMFRLQASRYVDDHVGSPGPVDPSGDHPMRDQPSIRGKR